jgi:hypothetical protein
MTRPTLYALQRRLWLLGLHRLSDRVLVLHHRRNGRWEA